MKFDEYLSSKGLVGKPVVSLDGDRLDPENMPNTPPGGGKPYAAKNEKSKKNNKPFGDEGDEELKYVPKVDNNSKGKTAATIPTVDEVALAVKISNAAVENPAILETVVRQLKNLGLLGALVAETLNHRETFKHLSQVMAHESYGPDVCNKLVRAMHEEVAAPFGDQLNPEDEDDDIEADDENDYMPMGNDEDDDMEDMGDEDNMGDDEDMGEDDMGDEGDMGDDSEGGMPMDQSNMGGEEMGPPMDPNMMANKPAMQNLQKAMMRSFMRQMMSKY